MKQPDRSVAEPSRRRAPKPPPWVLILAVAAAVTVASTAGDSANLDTSQAARTITTPAGPAPADSEDTGAAENEGQGQAEDAGPDAAPDAAQPQTDQRPDEPSVQPADRIPVEGTALRKARVPVPAADEKKAAESVGDYLGKAASALTTSAQPSEAELAAIARGSALGAFQASIDEFESNYWRQTGQPSVAYFEVVGFDESSEPNRMTVNVCIDSSDVKVITAENEVIRAGSSADRSLNILTLVQTDSGQWVVEHLSFPDDPSC